MLRRLLREGRRSAWLLCVCCVTLACSGEDLETFSRRVLSVNVRRTVGDERLRLTAALEFTQGESGCPQLGSDTTATLNGESLMVFRGTPPAPSGACEPPTAATWVEATRFEGPPQDALLEFQDGEQRIVAEFRNYFALHALARAEQPVVVKPGQEVFFAWDPATDDLSEVREVQLNRGTFLRAQPEPGGLRITFPADLPAGPAQLAGLGFYKIPVVRCEGVAACEPLLNDRYEDTLVDILIQP